MKTVLVVGAYGFIGRELRHELEDAGITVIAPTKDQLNVSDKESFTFCNKEPINHVIHLAAKTFVPASWDDPGGFFDVNVGGTKNVLEYCRTQSIPMTYISAYLYGKPERLPISECSNLFPNNPYAHSKFLAEQLCEFYSREYKLNITVIRPFNIYGAGQNEKFLIPSIIRQAICDESIKVKDLQPKRDYLYIRDLVDAICKTVLYAAPEKEQNYNVYNIGAGYSVSVEQIINIVQEILGIAKPVVSEMTVRHNEINDVIADISKANRQMNWFPRYSLISGLTETIYEYKRKI